MDVEGGESVPAEVPAEEGEEEVDGDVPLKRGKGKGPVVDGGGVGRLDRFKFQKK